jgi:zinc transporter
VRLQPLRLIDRLRDAVKRGTPLRSTVEIEDKLLAGRMEIKRADLGALRRLLVRLQRMLAPEPAALLRLLQKPPAWFGEEDLQDLNQSTEEFNMALRDMTRYCSFKPVRPEVSKGSHRASIPQGERRVR